LKIEEKYIEANGMRFFYRETGSPDKPLLILFHGGGLTGYVNWSKHYEPLSEHFHIISPDHRGHGKTSNPGGKFTTYGQLAWDMIGFLKALRFDKQKPNVMGHSSGAMIALHMSVYEPELFSRQVLIGIHPYLGVSEFYKRGIEKYYSTPDYRNPPTKWAFITKYPLDAISLWWSHHTYNWHDLITRAWPMWIKPLELEKSDYKKIKCPTLVITGTRDEFGEEHEAKDLAKWIKGAEFIPLDGEKHMFVVTNPKLLRENVLPFLTQIQ